MVIVLGVLVIVFLVLLAAGALTGRVRVTSCCAVADPRRDARMRGAFSEHLSDGAEPYEPDGQRKLAG